MSPTFRELVFDPSLNALSCEEFFDRGTAYHTIEEMLRLYTCHYDYEDDNSFVTVNDLGLEGHVGLGKHAVF